jgi:hypothetical protein
MADLTETVIAGTEFAGKFKLVVVTATPGSASDTITLSQAQTGIQSIAAIIGCVITTGADANLLTAHVTFSGLVATVVTKGADGLAATDWTGASITLTVLGNL